MQNNNDGNGAKHVQ